MGDIDKFCDAMRWAADSDQVGYSQSDRYNLGPGDFFGGGLYNTDCSSLIIAAAQHAGFDTGWASYTGNMSDAFCANGWERLSNDGNPQRGDILLNDINHVAVWLGDCLCQASIDENGNIAGGARGDQTGFEVQCRSYYNYPWDCYLRWTHGNDKEDDDMVCVFKPNGEGYLVYYDGHSLHPLSHPDELEAINMVYRETHNGKDVPMFDLGSGSAPWASRFFDVVNREWK